MVSLMPTTRHILVAVLLAVSAATVATGQKAASKNIVDVLTTLPEYSGFVSLLRKEGLLPQLRGLADLYPLTIFAPRNRYLQLHVDKAFLAFLQTPAQMQLYKEILLYHFTRAGVIDYSKFSNGLKFPSIQGSNLTVSRDNARMRYNVERSPIRKPNVFVSPRGAIHGINGLLLFKDVRNLINPLTPNSTCT